MSRPLCSLFPRWLAQELAAAADITAPGPGMVQINRVTEELVKLGLVRAREDVSREHEWAAQRVIAEARSR